MAGSSASALLHRLPLTKFSESASLNIEAVRTAMDFYSVPFLRTNSFSKDTAIIPKARSHGRNMAE